MTDDDTMTFTLDWLAEAAGRKPQLTACPDGHLVVRSNTHWTPVAFSNDLRSLICRPVTHD
ncbi:hypothetical protein Ade02nite_19540 [Paractinoplanes deccanensis]|uniref:Uncharacterized protein n=1 Tax=Paractinoplanes deccanensis TaxID=113561 RepID=A0ABQ3XZZ0_9ACTN|nr:hypothetical protein [Actinoplanes deccanensis]GID73313.1 hypothetical protein Ade02nite_19540 [Actinoplanes deccanensis]